MRFAANVAFLFTEQPWLRRFEAAAEAGFGAVEFPWPDHPPRDVIAAVAAAGVDVVLLNVHGGDLSAGDRGYANDPQRIEAFRRALDEALQLATDLGCPVINVLAGRAVGGVPPAVQQRTLETNLAWALSRARGSGIRLLIEVLNHHDVADYLFTRLAPAAALVRAFDDPGLRLQFDAYHVARVEPDLLDAYRSVAELVAHVQLADTPGRGEPGTGAAPLFALLRQLATSGYTGAVALEYVPSVETHGALDWLPRALRSGVVTDLSALGPGDD
ncbi:hydroxypyruvate isomerase family protein [Egicoccus sp. AB-alg6-2]|uniref:hydroxypyruvate isomerase family protein n=1 Tax=Egicoccus sp. AB-alg6-2 TaxID=3242692 RepID=UPI00359CE3B7